MLGLERALMDVVLFVPPQTCPCSKSGAEAAAVTVAAAAEKKQQRRRTTTRWWSRSEVMTDRSRGQTPTPARAPWEQQQQQQEEEQDAAPDSVGNGMGWGGVEWSGVRCGVLYPSIPGLS